MPASTTALALPYPLATEPVSQGDDAIKALAERLEVLLSKPWTPYTPAVTPWTLSTSWFRYRADGVNKTLHIAGGFTATAFPAGNLSIPLPSGFAAYQAAPTATDYRAIGTWQGLRTGVVRYSGVAQVRLTENLIQFGVSGSGTPVTYNNPATWQSGDIFSFNVTMEHT